MANDPRAAEGPDPRLKALTLLLQVEQEARKAETREALSFVFVNDVRSVLAARQVVFWAFDDFGRHQVRRVSNVSDVDPASATVLACQEMARWLSATEEARKPSAFTRSDLPESLRSAYPEEIDGFFLHLPLVSPRGGLPGGLLLRHDAPWNEGHLMLAGLLGDTFAHAWQALEPPRRTRTVLAHLRKHRLKYVAGAVVLLLLPLRQYVLAPAEVVPIDPVVVAAPLPGVIREVLVAPNQGVKAGDVLFVYEDTELVNRVAAAERAYEVAEAEYLKNAQEAFSCDPCRGRMVQAQAAMARERSQVEWARMQQELGVVKASLDGVVVFSDASDWAGRPVSVGEKVMLLADEERVRLRIALPIEDAIATERNTPVVFYPNVSPLSTYDCRVEQTAYEATPQADNTVAYVLYASLEEPGARLGWRGTAKVYGDRAPLAYQILRKPLGWLRRATGF
jgi:hypothetical protein